MYKEADIFDLNKFCREGNLIEVKRIIEDENIDPSISINSPLYNAISNNKFEIVKYLLSFPSVNPNDILIPKRLFENNNESIINLVIDSGRFDIVKAYDDMCYDKW